MQYDIYCDIKETVICEAVSSIAQYQPQYDITHGPNLGLDFVSRRMKAYSQGKCDIMANVILQTT